jgi:hypothetical protein
VSGPGRWWPRFEAKGGGRLIVAVARRRWAVGRRGSARRGWPAVAGGGSWGGKASNARAVLGMVQVWSEEDRCGLASRRLSAAAAAAQLR